MEGWSPQLPTGFLVPRGTHAPVPRAPAQSAYGTLTLSGRPFQQRSAPTQPPAAALPLGPDRPSNPVAASGRQPSGRRRFGLLPFRSPLLRESLSLPRGTEMFHFPRCPPSQSSKRSPSHPSQEGGAAPHRARLPHSDTPGSPLARSSPGRFAARPRPSSALTTQASTVCPSPQSAPVASARHRQTGTAEPPRRFRTHQFSAMTHPLAC